MYKRMNSVQKPGLRYYKKLTKNRQNAENLTFNTFVI